MTRNVVLALPQGRELPAMAMNDAQERALASVRKR
jgi:hypothetical protein